MSDVQLTKGQEQALSMVRAFLAQDEECLAILTGYAGTGKTWSLKLIDKEFGLPIVLAPTGKAALRVAEATGIEAMTIHRWMYKAEDDPKTGETKFILKDWSDFDDNLSGSLVIVDEASMVDETVWKDLKTVATFSNVKILLVGDPFQLPPVNKTRDAKPFCSLELETPFKVHMTEVVRQALDSPIIRASMLLRSGRPEHEAFQLLTPIAPSKLIENVIRLQLEDGCVIVHRNVTRHDINVDVREAKNLPKGTVEPGEPLLVLQNNYQLDRYNGEVVRFQGWIYSPTEPKAVRDRYSQSAMELSFGVGSIDAMKCSICPEEINGRTLTEKMGNWTVKKASKDSYKRRTDIGFSGKDEVPPHLHANYGYALTAHKCVHPSTIVETPDGLMSIAELGPSGSIATATGKGSFSQKVINPSGAFLKVLTKGGFEAVVTPEHKMYCWSEEGWTPKSASTLKRGDWLRLKLQPVYSDQTPYRLPPTPAHDIRAVSYPLPIEMTAELAEFLGLLVADGHVTRKRLGIAKRHIDVVDRFSFLAQKLFPTARIIRFFSLGAHQAQIHSTYLASWLLSIGGLTSNNKTIPVAILRSSLPVQKAFLRGLFEDGTVNMKDSETLDHVSLSNVSSELIRIVQIMLLRMGIISSRSYREKDGHPISSLYIYGQHAHYFRDRIGFVSQFKQSRLNLEAAEECRWMVPLSLRQIESLSPLMSSTDKNNVRSRRKISRHLARALSARGASWLDELLDWHYVQVTSAEPAPEDISMCVTVPEGHRFLQNGFDLGNSQGSEWREILLCVEGSLRAMMPIEQKRFLYTAITRAKEKVSYVFV